MGVRLGALVFEGVGHAGKHEPAQGVEGILSQHGRLLFLGQWV